MIQKERPHNMVARSLYCPSGQSYRRASRASHPSGTGKHRPTVAASTVGWGCGWVGVSGGGSATPQPTSLLHHPPVDSTAAEAATAAAAPTRTAAPERVSDSRARRRHSAARAKLNTAPSRPAPALVTTISGSWASHWTLVRG